MVGIQTSAVGCELRQGQSREAKAAEVPWEAMAEQPGRAIPSSGTGHQVQPRAPPGAAGTARFTHSERCQSREKLGSSFSAEGSFREAVGIGGTGVGLTRIGSNRLTVGVNKWDCVLLGLVLC